MYISIYFTMQIDGRLTKYADINTYVGRSYKIKYGSLDKAATQGRMILFIYKSNLMNKTWL